MLIVGSKRRGFGTENPQMASLCGLAFSWHGGWIPEGLSGVCSKGRVESGQAQASFRWHRVTSSRLCGAKAPQGPPRFWRVGKWTPTLGGVSQGHLAEEHVKQNTLLQPSLENISCHKSLKSKLELIFL